MNTIRHSTRRNLRSLHRGAVETLEQRIVPAGIFKWNVDSSGNWNVPGNWQLVSGDVGPGYPDDVDDTARFGNVITADRTIFIPDGVTVGADIIEFNDNNNYTIASGGSGKLRLGHDTGNLSVLDTAGTDAHVISANIELADSIFLTPVLNTSITLSGAISSDNANAGHEGLYQFGAGSVILSGSAPNTFDDGISMNAGTLFLGKTAGVPAFGGGALFIGGGGGITCKAIFTSSNQFPDNATLLITADGEALLGSTQQTVNGVSMFIGSSGGGALISMSAGGKLSLLQYLATGFGFGGTSNATISGAVELLNNATFNIADQIPGSDLVIDGPILGVDKTLTKQGNGTLEIDGTAPSTYGGTTTIAAGTIYLHGGTSDGALSPNIVVNSGATLQVGSIFELMDSATLTLIGKSKLILDQNDDVKNLVLFSDATGAPEVMIAAGQTFSIRTDGQLTIGGSGQAPSKFTGDGNLRFFSNAQGIQVNHTNSIELDAIIDVSVTENLGGTVLPISGTGALRFDGGVNTTGPMQISGATVVSLSDFKCPIVLDGGTLKGSGNSTVGLISSTPTGGRVDPGFFSLLKTGNVQFGSADTLAVSVNGTTSGSLQVTGTVTLNDAALDLSVLTPAKTATSITILSNDGNDPIVGHFAGLPNDGDTVVTSRGNFLIDYTGGDGNDVTLTPAFFAPKISVDGKSATYTDADGDLVTVKTTRGKFDTSLFTLRAAGAGAILQDLNISDPAKGFEGARLTFTATPKNGAGNRHVDVGRINAVSLDLGGVIVPGNIDVLIAGDADFTDKAGLGLLIADSVGVARNDTESFARIIAEGPTGSILIKGSVVGATIEAGRQSGVKSIFVGGSLALDPKFGRPGELDLYGSAGSIVIGGDVVGGTFSNLGVVNVDGNVGSLTVKGSLRGATGLHSGSIDVQGKIAKLLVGGNVLGGDGVHSGEIVAESLGFATIGGSVLGGNGIGGGSVYGGHAIGSLTIGGDVQAGDGTRSGSVSALLGTIAKLTVKGSLIGGASSDTGVLAHKLGAITIGKDLRGANGGRVLIGADYTSAKTTQDALLIGSVNVGGSVSSADILAGYELSAFTPTTADAQIGAITVKGHWTASRALAGVKTLNGTHGDADDVAAFAGGNAAITSRIAKIVIGGSVNGVSNPSVLWAFEAQQFGAISIGGKALKLSTNPATHDVFALGPFADVIVREIA
jgi:autotransporter-associated beta strand protein